MRNNKKQLLQTAILNLLAINHIMAQIIKMIDKLADDENP
jgi:hypothetical protein